MNICTRKEGQHAVTATCDSEKPDLISNEGKPQIHMDNLFTLPAVSDDMYVGAINCCGTV
jgi:hypothetical protein